MFTKDEMKNLKTDFWNGFKKTMQNVKSANGRKMNWLNYPTDVKDIYLRCEADQHGARLCFDFQMKDAGIRQLFWEQMVELKKVLELETGTDAMWIENTSSFSVPQFNRIVWENPSLNFYNQANHPQIYAFLKERLIAFDKFYQEFKDILINLAL